MAVSESSDTHEYARGYKDGQATERDRCAKIADKLELDNKRLRKELEEARERVSCLSMETSRADWKK